MSNPGERDDAPEVELETEIDEGLVAADTDEGGDDEVDGDSGEGDEHLAEGDHESKGDGERGAVSEVAVKPRSAATIAVQTAKRAAKENAERAERAEQRLAEIERDRQGRQTLEEQRLEAERIALMPPEEKFDHLLRRQEERTRQEVGALRFQMQDAGDRVAFESRCARVPAMEAVRDEVERQIAELRRGGGNTTRETLATYLIGKRAIESAGRLKSKQAAKGAANIQRQTARPVQGSGGVPAGDRRGGGDDRSARAKRLENQEI